MQTDLSTLTEKERLVMLLCTETEYDGNPWNWAVQSAVNMGEKAYGGVVSSLIQKGLCTIEDYEGKGRSDDMVFYLTDEGREVNAALAARAEAAKRVITQAQWDEKKRHGYASMTFGQPHVLAMDEKTGATVLEPVRIEG